MDSSPITISLSNNEPPPFSVFEPLLLKSTDKVEIQSELTPGWNWVSVNVVNDPETTVEDAFKSVDATHIAQIKAHNAQKVYYTSNQWQPDAQDAVDPNMRYEVQMNTGGSTSWTMSNISTMADHEVYTKVSSRDGMISAMFRSKPSQSKMPCCHLPMRKPSSDLTILITLKQMLSPFMSVTENGSDPWKPSNRVKAIGCISTIPTGPTCRWNTGMARLFCSHARGFRTSGPAVDGLVEHDDVLGDNGGR